MAYATQRRFPRIPFEQPAEIEYLDRSRGHRVVCPVALRTIACEGVSIASPKALELHRRSRVTVKFAIEGESVSLPGAVAWLQAGGLGVHLLLELAVPETRQRWARWIVEKTSAHNRGGRRPRTSKTFLKS